MLEVLGESNEIKGQLTKNEYITLLRDTERDEFTYYIWSSYNEDPILNGSFL